jgi:hypothetical protein
LRVWRGTFLLEKIEVHASSKYIKFRVESCKSQSHLNSIRFTLCSLCLGWYPAKSRLLWNYGMNINHIYIMFAVFEYFKSYVSPLTLILISTRYNQMSQLLHCRLKHVLKTEYNLQLLLFRNKISLATDIHIMYMKGQVTTHVSETIFLDSCIQ